MPPNYSLSDFDFNLPEQLIAQTPPEHRGESRLLRVFGQTKSEAQRAEKSIDSKLNDLQFAQILSLVRPGDALVLNNTKVVPARLFATKPTGGKIEMLFERMIGPLEFLAQIKASHKPAVGQTIQLRKITGSPLQPQSPEQQQGIGVSDFLTVKEYKPPFVVMQSQKPVMEILHAYGEIPLPPYIARQAGNNDLGRYQTVYAKHEGAVAAPTAGLHFTDELLKQITDLQVDIVNLTLHVGAGTFAPIRTDNLDEHKMHHEWFEISAQAAQQLNSVRANGARIVVVGTTSLRALESANMDGHTILPTVKETDIFIRPGYQFKNADSLITNFHLPKSTLMMLVSAFAGYETVMDAYQHAIQKQYRFFSYGDAMWLDRAQ